MKILGQPNDVVQAIELPDFVSTFYPRSEYWNYGSAGRLTFATQGHISFDDRGRITNIVGQAEPIPSGLFDEQKLQEMLRTLHQVGVPGSTGEFHPGHLIRAVNMLHALGKETAMLVVEEYVRVAPDEKMFEHFDINQFVRSERWGFAEDYRRKEFREQDWDSLLRFRIKAQLLNLLETVEQKREQRSFELHGDTS